MNTAVKRVSYGREFYVKKRKYLRKKQNIKEINVGNGESETSLHNSYVYCVMGFEDGYL